MTVSYARRRYLVSAAPGNLSDTYSGRAVPATHTA